jgi:hypothetical protein
MRAWIPLLQALGANSPFWYGRGSGLASARSVICNSFPRAGIPRRHEREGGMRLLLRRLADETVPPAIRRRADDATTPAVQTMTIHRQGRFDTGAAAGAAA